MRRRYLYGAELLVGHDAGRPAIDRAEQRVPGLLEAGLEAGGALAGIRDADRDGLPSSAWTRRDPLDERGRAGEGTRRSARIESSRWSNSDPGVEARSAFSTASSGGRDLDDDVRRSRSQPSRAARPSSVAADVARRASCSKKSLIRFFSVSRSISSIFLIATAVWFAAARARSTSVVPSATSSPSSSSSATSGTATRRSGRSAPAPARARRGRSSRAPPRRREPRPSAGAPPSRRRAGRRGMRGAERAARVRSATAGSSSSSFSRPRDRLRRARSGARARPPAGASPRTGAHSRSRLRRARRSR